MSKKVQLLDKVAISMATQIFLYYIGLTKNCSVIEPLSGPT